MALALVAACGGSGSKHASTSSEKPEAAAQRHITEVVQGQWGLAYNDLLAQQQTAISQATFIKCFEQIRDSIPEISKIEVIKVYNEKTPTPGAGDLDSTAVTVRVTTKGGQTETQTVHEYNVGGQWRGSVDQASFDAESKGQCPTG